MSYNDKIDLVADEMVKFAKRKIEMEFDGTLRRQRHQLECFEAYYEIYKKHFGDLIDHRISDKISVLGGCLGCLFKSICESAMEIDAMNTVIEKYIRLQVTTMNLWSC
jgi:hypothetical protein